MGIQMTDAKTVDYKTLVVGDVVILRKGGKEYEMTVVRDSTYTNASSFYPLILHSHLECEIFDSPNGYYDVHKYWDVAGISKDEQRGLRITGWEDGLHYGEIIRVVRKKDQTQKTKPMRQSTLRQTKVGDHIQVFFSDSVQTDSLTTNGTQADAIVIRQDSDNNITDLGFVNKPCAHPRIDEANKIARETFGVNYVMLDRSDSWTCLVMDETETATPKMEAQNKEKPMRQTTLGECKSGDRIQVALTSITDTYRNQGTSSADRMVDAVVIKQDNRMGIGFVESNNNSGTIPSTEEEREKFGVVFILWNRRISDVCYVPNTLNDEVKNEDLNNEKPMRQTKLYECKVGDKIQVALTKDDNLFRMDQKQTTDIMVDAILMKRNDEVGIGFVKSNNNHAAVSPTEEESKWFGIVSILWGRWLNAGVCYVQDSTSASLAEPCATSTLKAFRMGDEVFLYEGEDGTISFEPTERTLDNGRIIGWMGDHVVIGFDCEGLGRPRSKCNHPSAVYINNESDYKYSCVLHMDTACSSSCMSDRMTLDDHDVGDLVSLYVDANNYVVNFPTQHTVIGKIIATTKDGKCLIGWNERDGWRSAPLNARSDTNIFNCGDIFAEDAINHSHVLILDRKHVCHLDVGSPVHLHLGSSDTPHVETNTEKVKQGQAEKATDDVPEKEGSIVGTILMGGLAAAGTLFGAAMAGGQKGSVRVAECSVESSVDSVLQEGVVS
jgi:hypothetical protein